MDLPLKQYNVKETTDPTSRSQLRWTFEVEGHKWELIQFVGEHRDQRYKSMICNDSGRDAPRRGLDLKNPVNLGLSRIMTYNCKLDVETAIEIVSNLVVAFDAGATHGERRAKQVLRAAWDSLGT